MMDMMDGHDDEGAGAAASASTGGAKKSAKSAIAVAKAKILKTVSKQHLVDHILPVLSSLKHVLEAARSSAQVMNDNDEHHDDDDLQTRRRQQSEGIDERSFECSIRSATT